MAPMRRSSSCFRILPSLAPVNAARPVMTEETVITGAKSPHVSAVNLQKSVEIFLVSSGSFLCVVSPSRYLPPVGSGY